MTVVYTLYVCGRGGFLRGTGKDMAGPMVDLLPCVEVGPAQNAQGAVIWLHGLGANGHDFEPLVPLLELPQVRFVFPHAPQIPVTINQGWIMPAWYDITGLGNDLGRTENADHVYQSAQAIEALIERELRRGIAVERLILAGFSQGAAMALHVGLRSPRELAGLLLLSGYLVVPERLKDEAQPRSLRAPMLFCHGAHDDIVPISRGRLAYERVSELAPEPEAIRWQSFAMGHEVCPEEVGVIRDWLHERLA